MAHLVATYEVPLPDQSMDRVFMVKVLCEVPNKLNALRETRRVPKSDGLLTVGEALFGPDYPRQETTITWCREVGLELKASHGRVLRYVLLFRPLDR